MIALGPETLAISERAVMHDDAADAARTRSAMGGVAALEVNDRRHDAPPLLTSATRTCFDPVDAEDKERPPGNQEETRMTPHHFSAGTSAAHRVSHG
jgi:hypothetical protein